MNVLWSSSLLKELVNASSNKEWKASGVEIDSRKVKKGDLFCALSGANLNGHDFINSASNKGASACLISENIKNTNNIALAKVNNVLDALENMAKMLEQDLQLNLLRSRTVSVKLVLRI